MSEVEYRDIPGLPHYRAGNDGSIWSGLSGEWRKLKPSLSKARPSDPYLCLTVYCNGFRLHRYVHQLVLLAFVGPCPEGKQTCHWDGDPSNNRPENLRWGTPAENMADMRRHGRFNPKKLSPEEKRQRLWTKLRRMVANSPAGWAAELRARSSPGWWMHAPDE